MKNSMKRMSRLILRKKNKATLDKNLGIRASCPFCHELKPTSKMVKSKVDGKYYCNKRHMKKGLEGEKLLTRMELLAGLKK